MKKFIMVVVALLYSFIGINIVFAADDTWTQKADFGGAARYYAIGFSIGSKGYIGMGWIDSSCPKDFWEYDPIADTWTQKADFGGAAREEAVGFSIGNKGYIGTGYDGASNSYYKDFWEYDPAANTWTQKADFGGGVRDWAAGFSVGSKGYIGTGFDGSSYTKDFWEYDPAIDTWTQKADFGGGVRARGVGFSIGSKGYTGTGYNVSSPYYYNDFWEYDPAIDTWTQKADFGGTGRSTAVGFSIGNKGYIGTGAESVFPYKKKDFWEYDPAIDTWTQKADFGGGERYYAVGFSIESKGYIGTGWDRSSSKKDFWVYEPTTASVTMTFEGLTEWEEVGDYYNGGYGYDYNTGLPKSGPGKNYGVYFLPNGNMIASIDADAGGEGNFGGEPSPSTAIWFQQGGAWMNIANGFSGSLSFYYSNPNNPSKIYIYDDLNKTGNLLATLDLPLTPYQGAMDPTGDLSPLVQASVSFAGVAKSVDFGELANSAYVDDITLGALNPPPYDTIPDKFIFNYETGVDLNTVITSNIITVSGIDGAAPISITEGTYSVNGGSYTSASGMVNNSDTVTVQQTSSGNYSTTTIAALTIGGISDTYRVTTKDASGDITPNAFHFIDLKYVALNTDFRSNAITVSGINAAAPISITGGTYSINGGAYTSASGTVVKDNIVRVKLTSADTYSTTTSATLTIGGVSDTFSVTTRRHH